MQEAGARWTQRSWTVYLHTVEDEGEEKEARRPPGGEWLMKINGYFNKARSGQHCTRFMTPRMTTDGEDEDEGTRRGGRSLEPLQQLMGRLLSKAAVGGGG